MLNVEEVNENLSSQSPKRHLLVADPKVLKGRSVPNKLFVVGVNAPLWCAFAPLVGVPGFVLVRDFDAAQALWGFSVVGVNLA